MKIKYFLIFLVLTSLIISCKSKQQVVTKPVTVKKETVKKPSKTEKKIVVKSKPNSTIKNSTLDYIEQFRDAAIMEMKAYKIPASITMAQGILESSSGNSELTKKSNNHFGIKCHKAWKGGRTYHDDDEKGECFRVYKNPDKSYRDHSLFLAFRTRYSKLFKLHPGDYVGWAKGLSEAGYATDRRYPAKLIGLIEKYELHKLDTEVLGEPYKKPEQVVATVKDVHIVVKGDTLYNISNRYGLTVNELKRINGLTSNNIMLGQSIKVKK